MSPSNQSAAVTVRDGPSNALEGWTLVGIGTFEIFLYILTLLALIKDKDLMAFPVYKFVAAFGFMDLFVVLGNSIVNGIYTIVESTGPTQLNQFTNCVILICWFTSSTLDVVTAINRITVIMLRNYKHIFDGKKVYYWIAGSAVVPVCMEAGLYVAGIGMLYDPIARVSGYTDTGAMLSHVIYTNVAHMGSLLLSLVALGALLMLKRKKSQQNATLSLNAKERRAFYQVVVLNSSQVLLDVVYFQLAGEWQQFFGCILASFVCGQTPYVLLVFNDSVRATVLKYLGCNKKKKNCVDASAAVTGAGNTGESSTSKTAVTAVLKIGMSSYKLKTADCYGFQQLYQKLRTAAIQP